VTEYIEIRGAARTTSRTCPSRIPKRQITIFTGVSGSGKSSVVFDTIATEAQRQLYENFSMFIRSFLPRYPAPEADAIENLSMAVIVDQKRLGGGSHSTVGTVTDIFTALRLLFSRLGEPHVGYSNAFSFNDPEGMCPECNGLGWKIAVVADDFIDMNKTLNEGAIQMPMWVGFELAGYAASAFFDNDKKIADFSKEELDRLTVPGPGQAGGSVAVRVSIRGAMSAGRWPAARKRRRCSPLRGSARCASAYSRRASSSRSLPATNSAAQSVI
jgi:excinuclease UvrABC ATPase subunit